MKHPSRSGVYALKHKATGKVYVGSAVNLVERKSDWMQNMRRNPQDVPPLIRELSLDPSDWEFRVLWRGEASTTPELLAKVERETVACIRRKAPEKLLNLLAVVRPDAAFGLTVNGRTQSGNAWARERGIPRATILSRISYGWTAEQVVGLAPPPTRDRSTEHYPDMLGKSKVLVMDGTRPLSQAEAAQRLGCLKETLSNRLRGYRLPTGQARVQLSYLQALSEKHRR